MSERRPALPARRPRGQEPASSGAGLIHRRELELVLPDDYESVWILRFLAARAVDGVEEVGAGGVRRGLWLDGAPLALTLSWSEAPAGGTIQVEAASRRPISALSLRRAAERLLGLAVDLAAFQALAAGDPTLGPLVARRPGLRVAQYADPFEGAVRAVLGQLVSLEAARALARRLVAALGRPVPGAGGLRCFPRPEALAAAGPERLAALGLTRNKATALAALGQEVGDGRLDLEALRLASGEEAERALLAIPGIGPWTASYIRMRALGDPDAFPASDLGVLKSLRDALARPGLDGREALALAEGWRPWRSLAALHLWTSPAAGVRTARTPRAPRRRKVIR